MASPVGPSMVQAAKQVDIETDPLPKKNCIVTLAHLVSLATAARTNSGVGVSPDH